MVKKCVCLWLIFRECVRSLYIRRNIFTNWVKENKFKNWQWKTYFLISGGLSSTCPLDSWANRSANSWSRRSCCNCWRYFVSSWASFSSWAWNWNYGLVKRLSSRLEWKMWQWQSSLQSILKLGIGSIGFSYLKGYNIGRHHQIHQITKYVSPFFIKGMTHSLWKVVRAADRKKTFTFSDVCQACGLYLKII